MLRSDKTEISPLQEPVAHKLPLSDAVQRDLAEHHLARRIIVRCPGCPFDYALTVPEEIWFNGKTEQYREALIAYLRTTECGRHPSHIVWTRGKPLAIGQIHLVPKLPETPQQAPRGTKKSQEEALSGPLVYSGDHLYWAVQCVGWGCDNWIFLCDLGECEGKKTNNRKVPKRIDVTCPACATVATYGREDIRQVRAQQPPADWIDHPAFED